MAIMSFSLGRKRKASVSSRVGRQIHKVRVFPSTLFRITHESSPGASRRSSVVSRSTGNSLLKRRASRASLHLRRSGSRLLARLNGKREVPPEFLRIPSAALPNDECIGPIPPERPSIAPSTTTSTQSAKTVFSNFKRRCHRRHDLAEAATAEPLISNYDGGYEATPPTIVVTEPSRDLRLSKSTPSLSQQLHRISTVLASNSQTVVHRPNHASRPTILTGDNTQDSYTPSPPFGPVEISTKSSVASFFRSPVTSNPPSPGYLSTPPSSFFSSGDSRSNGKSTRPTTSSGLIPGLATINEAPTKFFGVHTPEKLEPVEVSIVTVENASAAKIFLETFYSKLYPNQVMYPRSMRRRSFEKMLASSPLSVYERQDERLRYFKSESQHLRQIRALKSKGTRPANTNKLSVANYEVTRVLGKGSFGVVKLVRQKMDGEPDAKEALKVDSAENDTLTPDIQKLFGAKRTPAMDLNKLKHEVYAMKVIRKSDMLRNSQEGHLRAERDFLVASANSQWVVPLIASFQDFNHLYLVMEYMVGGDFLGLLLREDVLPEWATKWYIAEMILCVEEAHKMKWIHRDVKPDNFLIASNGHLKISDFGLAFDGHWSHHQQYHNATRESLCQNLGLDVIGDAVDIESEQERNKKNLESVVTGRPYQPGDFAASASRPGGNLVIDKLNNGWKRRLAKSVVGTSQYMCPEVIRGDQYDGRCDWWSIGIILYECLYGRTPFYCDTRELTKKNIVQHEQTLGFPTYPRYHRPQSGNAKPLPPVSHSAIDLISSLLTEKETRLSCRRYKDNDLWHARRGRPIASRAARTSTSGTPYFVFDNDAEDIKNHSFFKGVEWSEMHLSRPPWMPVIGRDQSIARWFEDESEIVDSSGEGGTSDNPIPTPPTIAVTPATDNMIPTPSPATAQIGTCKQPEATATSSSISQDQDEPVPVPEDTKDKKQHVKEKKRPRDKILRDPDMAPTALAERKAKAFLGYTYRRPEGFDLSGMEERVGRKLVRASVYGLVGGAAA